MNLIISFDVLQCHLLHAECKLAQDKTTQLNADSVLRLRSHLASSQITYRTFDDNFL